MEQDRDVGVERRPGHHGGVVEVAEAVHFLPFPRVAQQTVPAEKTPFISWVGWVGPGRVRGSEGEGGVALLFRSDEFFIVTLRKETVCETGFTVAHACKSKRRHLATAS